MSVAGGQGNAIVWIAWERQRRTLELASALGADLHILLSGKPWLLRAAVLGCRTTALLARRRPAVLIVQNPSILLTSLACALRRVFGYRLVVDRHSNFKFHTAGRRALKWRVFHTLSRWTSREADLTIVTNEPLRRVVEEWGGRAMVLQDRLPRLDAASALPLGSGAHVACVNSFNQDEPVAELVAAARLAGPGVTFHVTGNAARCPRALRDSAPPNLRFTGYLAEPDYQSLLASADVVMVLTRQDHTLVCGAYEAVSLGKPLVLSDTGALRGYFRRGVVFAHNQDEDLVRAVHEALERRDALAEEVRLLATELAADWSRRFADLGARIERLSNGAANPQGAGG